MEILQKKSVAIGVMSLVIFVSLMVFGQVSFWITFAVVAVLLIVFAIIDIVGQSDNLTKGKRKSVCIAIGIISAALIFGFDFLLKIEPNPTAGNSGNKENIIVGASASPSAKTEKQTDATYDQAVSYYEKGDYEQAIKTLRKVQSSSDYYTEAQELLAEATDYYYPVLMERASTYAENGDYKLAASILESGIEVFPGNEDLVQTQKDYLLTYTTQVRTTAIESASASAGAGDYASAVQEIRSAIDDVGHDAELDILLEQYIETCRNTALDQAAAAFSSSGYQEAVSVIESCLTILPNDPALLAACTEYQSYAPIAVTDLEVWKRDGGSGSWQITNETVTDNYGNTYDSSIRLYDNFCNYTYKIDRAYSELTGTLFVRKEDNSGGGEGEIYVYGWVDGGNSSLLYSVSIHGGYAPINFTVDITNVDFLKIYTRADTSWHGGDPVGHLANLLLWK